MLALKEETLDVEKVARQLVSEISDKIKNLKTLNIIVAGKTGVGKSTLINSVFRDKLAETGMGKPVTEHMRKIAKNGIPLSIYDTRGFELGKKVQDEVKREIVDTIKKSSAMNDIDKAIHCIWYCINTASNRVEPEEIEWLRELSKENKTTQVPIIIVLTQSFSKNKAETLRKMLLDENLDVIQIVPVLAENYEINEEYVAKSYGLDKLIDVMAESLPKELLVTLNNVQIASLREKKRHAQAAIATAVTAATGVATIPIPFSDCVALMPIQAGMIASITVIFGFDLDKSIITALLSSVLGAGGATLLGKTVVTNILKFIPGVNVATALVSGATAGILTAALGNAYIGIMELVFKGEMNINDLKTKSGKEKMADMFKSELKRKGKIV